MKKVVLVLAIVVGAAAATWAQGQGTALSIAFDSPSVACPDGNVTVDYTISTTAASAATVEVTLSGPAGFTPISGSYAILSGNVPGGWINAGRLKTFDGSFQASGLDDGTYSLQVCATQAGSGGNPDKTICRSQSIIVNCLEAEVNPCATVTPFGEVTHNTQISSSATAQIQFSGNFGVSANVEITGPNDFSTAGSVGRNGDSCNYHANWKFNNPSGADFFGNGGAGVYTVRVTGNGLALEFPVTLND